MPTDDDARLKKFRDQIDAIDQQILELMIKRVEIAEGIAGVKNVLTEPAIYRPEREAQVLRRLVEINADRLSSRDVEALFREVMSITRGSEAGLSVALLGPAGTFSEAAALQHFGSAINLRFQPTIEEIFEAVEDRDANFAVVPVENSTEGGVGATMDRLGKTDLLICGEIYLRVHHNLISQHQSLDQIRQVLAHPQALGQCRQWLALHLPSAQLIPCSSNAEAVRQASQESNSAAIASAVAADQFGLSVLKAHIEDESGNTTRFLVLSNRETPPSGNDKTSLMLSARNQPGALFHMLQPLVEAGVDMTKLESRPSRSALWEYVFFVDLKGHKEDPQLKAALQKVRYQAGLYRELGCYPAALN